MSRIKQILSQYQFNASKPVAKYSNLQVFDAKHKQTGIPYTVKIILNPQYQLEEYFKKIKGVVSDFVIRILQFAYEVSQSKMVIVQEKCEYGTLRKALVKCSRLDDDDSVFISKMLLNGHIDLLRQGVNWFGNENDIQITQNGVKLSWNNSMSYSQKCPFPDIIGNIGLRTNESSILPFPKNKVLNDLIQVSKENASQISLHPVLKKKDKVFKKKGKGWIAIKEMKVKGEYFQELTYLGVSEEYGFVRIKVMDDGEVDENLMKIYQLKASFVKIIDYYSEKGTFITVSEYSNDGTVQNYVKRLKSSNMALRQNQIEFFFFSVIQPIKFIHDSEVKSLNMLHIRNIYIENGIPKIGQPIPINENLRQKLIDRADVPDFYHTEFKNTPNSKNSIYDTYSIGVLLYKLMFTEYPIFPQGKVHIPTAPSYKENLKGAVKLFLNVGGSLEELQQQLQISDNVKLEVKNNERFLEQITKKNKKVVQVTNEKIEDSQLQFRQERENENKQNISIIGRFWNWLNMRGKDKQNKYANLHQSDYAGYRKCVTVLTVLLFYILTFFLLYLYGVVNLLGYTRLFTKHIVNIKGQQNIIIIPNFDTFLNQFDQVDDGTVGTLNQTMKCVIDNNEAYYDFIRPASPHWHIYLLLSIITMVIILTLKSIQLCRYSTSRVGFHHYDTTIAGTNQSRFAISSFVYFQLWFAFALFSFYYLFNYIFKEQHSPCFGGPDWTLLTETLFTDRFKFSLEYLIIFCIVFFFGILSFIHISRYQKFRYSLLVNPIFIFTPFYLALVIIIRVGAMSQFVPSFAHNESQIIGKGYLDVIGYFPQILVIIEVLLCLLIDFIFYKCVDSSIKKFVLQQSHSQQLKLDK